MTHPTLLIVAKAPVPGLAKTRIAETIGDDAAAELAAAALLDTLDAAIAVGWPVVVAMTGDLTQAPDAATRSPLRCSDPTVIEQRGEGLGERLANAHADADGGHGVVQVGMDTPQVTADDFLDAGALVAEGHRTIGPADDGGWWLLGLPHGADAAVLVDVPMSQATTPAPHAAALGRRLARRGASATWTRGRTRRPSRRTSRSRGSRPSSERSHDEHLRRRQRLRRGVRRPFGHFVDTVGRAEELGIGQWSSAPDWVDRDAVHRSLRQGDDRRRLRTGTPRRGDLGEPACPPWASTCRPKRCGRPAYAVPSPCAVTCSASCPVKVDGRTRCSPTATSASAEIPYACSRRLGTCSHPVARSSPRSPTTVSGLVRDRRRLRVDGRLSSYFEWAVVGLDAIDEVAAQAGMAVVSTKSVGGRHTATLVRVRA